VGHTAYGGLVVHDEDAGCSANIEQGRHVGAQSIVLS
jgi:hypothetical protein